MLTARRFASSLVVRMLALVLTTSSLGAAISYVQFSRFLTNDLTEVASARQAALADYVAGDIGRSVQERLGTLERLAADLPPGMAFTPETICPWLAERHMLQPAFPLGFTATNARGGPPASCATDGRSAEVAPGAATEVARALAGATVIGRPFRDARSGRPGLPFLVPIRNRSGDVRGVLAGTAGIAADGFLDLHSQGRIGQSGGLLLVSPSDRLFIGATEPAMVLRPTPPPGTNLLHDRAMDGYRGTGTTVNADGVEEISAIAAVPMTDWFVVARSPTADALATVARGQSMILWQRIPLMLLVAALVMALVIWWLRPLYHAARQAERMTLGDAPLAPLPVVRDDEIGHLTDSFNRLLAKLDQQQGELARLAHHDGLTGLPNRLLFADRVQQASSRARRNRTELAILFLDLDGFKQINDSLGHEAGDEALRQVAARLVGAVRASDTVARLGGDEFVVLAPDLAASADTSVQALIDKCIATVSQPMRLVDGQVCALGVSVGTAFSDGSRSLDALLAEADRAMYAAKMQGRLLQA